MIRSFKHKGLELFFRTGSRAGIDPGHAPKLQRLLSKLNAAPVAEMMDVPGARFHHLSGVLAQHCAVNVSGNWRLTFKFQHGDAYMVDYQDYQDYHWRL
ncbi:MAG: type II toxin-antitoxin system RelE/ParE family toxin [Sphingomonadaceae bacterium]